MQVISAVAVLSFLVCATPSLADPSDDYLSPHVAVGDKLPTVFSRTISLRGPGFDETVQRVSGTETDTVLAVTASGIEEDAAGRYDGKPSFTGETSWRDHMRAACYNGVCAPYAETSASLFPTLLWGDAPKDIRVGSTWTVRVDKPWELGPQGDEEIRVVRLDPGNQIATLERRGRGVGEWDGFDPKHASTIMAGGKALAVTFVPGGAQWEGVAVIRRGVILSDEIMVHQDVTMKSNDGQTFTATRRSYTLLNSAPLDSVEP